MPRPRPRPFDRVVRTQLVGPFLAHLRRIGVDPAPLMRTFALPEGSEHQTEVLLPLLTLRHFLDAASERAKDPFLGLHVAQGLERSTYGLVDYIARASPTVRESFRALSRYMGLLNDAMVFAFREGEGGEGTFTYGLADDPFAYGRHANEYGLALFVALGRELTGHDWAPRLVGFPHAPPADPRPLVAHFRCPVRFGTRFNTLVLGPEVLALPLHAAETGLLSALGREGVTRAPDDFVVRLRGTLAEALRKGAPRVGPVARALAVSTRTLQRRLSESGTSFQGEVDSTRRELAERYLQDPRLGVSEVAFLLGYAELATFDRAFKRWTGSTPREFRGGSGGGGTSSSGSSEANA